MTNQISKKSEDIHNELITELKRLYPPLFDAEGFLKKEELENLVDKYSVAETEKFEFKWAGKTNSKRIAFTQSTATLKANKKKSENFDNTDNLIIEGDNLEVLKLLQKSYFNKVKCIYIDPPYNTGKDFVYSDNYTEDKKEYWKINGVYRDGIKMDTNTESQGRYHSNWLNMMYPRLLLARNLLKDNGVIFVSIDDNEVHNLRKIMDEIFGEENFFTQIVVRSNIRGQTYKQIAKTHEYIIVYTKNAETELNELEKKGDMDDLNLTDSIGNYNIRELRNRNPKFGKFNRPNLFYPVYINPNLTDKDGFNPVSLIKSTEYCVEVVPLNSKEEESCWRWGKELFGRENNSDTLQSNVVAKVKKDGNYNIYEKYRKTTYKAKSIWLDKDIITEKGTLELGELSLAGYFDFPKPKALIKNVVSLSLNTDEIILDFFAGSGTTAHAVMELNKEDGGNRKFILVQIPEEVDKESEAYKAGFKTIADICIERVKRAGDKIQKEENGQQSIQKDTNLDTGFKVFYLTPSTFPENEFTPDSEKSQEENMKLLEEYLNRVKGQINLPFEPEHIIYEIALKDGFELNFKLIKLEEFTQNTIYKISDSTKEAYICLDNKILDSTIQALEPYKDTRFICINRAVDTTKKWNLQKTFGRNLWII